MLQRVVHALGLVLITCVGVRVGWWLVAPVLPSLGVLFVLAAIFYFLIVGPRVRS